MDQNQHARAKELFLKAVQLPAEAHAAFLDHEASGDRPLRDEVVALLLHHTAETIIAGTAEAGEGERVNTVIMDRRLAAGVKDEEAGEWESFSKGLPGLSDETCRILRRRLWIVTLVLMLTMLYVFLRALTSEDRSIDNVRTGSLLGMVVCFGVLSSRLPLVLRQVRIIELAVALNVAITTSMMDLPLIITSADTGDAATAVDAIHWKFHVWSIVILIYGAFMPNRWQRAACVLLPAACVPYAATFLICQWDVRVAGVLSYSRFDEHIPMPFVAALASVLVAHIIHTTRRDAFRAKRVAQYRLTKLLGVGGCGEVYHAEHLLLKRPCAVKVVRPELDADPQALARFQREVKATARLSHWNTVEVFDFGQTTDGMFYCVMELLPGMNLSELVKQHSPLPPARVIHLLTQTCGALQEAHDLGLVHRDIKPGNIFAARRGGLWDVAKVLDFGLVRETSVPASPQLSGVNTIAGTPHYMAPEQAAAFRSADARCDIYSLGAVGYYLLTGRPPFDADSSLEVLVAHTRDVVTPPSQIEDVPSDLEKVVLRCLQKDPGQRYQTAAELERALRECRCGEWSQEEAESWWAEHVPAAASS